MNRSLSVVSDLATPEQPTTPLITSPVDAEVDMEVLKAVPKAFAIDSEKHANWLVKKVLSARQYAARVKEWTNQELRRAEREEQTLLFLFGRQLEAWVRSELERLNGRRKSLNLPAGTVGVRHVEPSIRIDDEDAVLRWAATNCPNAVIVSRRLSRTEIKSHFDRTGELPGDGAHVEPGGERFFIR